MSIKGDILKSATDYYLKSNDFNGLPVRTLEFTPGRLRAALRTLIREDRASVLFGDIHPNPYIKALESEPADDQLKKLDSLDLLHACIYPSRGHLATVVRATDYTGRPFTEMMALGEPQLKFLPFDLRVLESYRNDPRYEYETDDVQGKISVREAYYQKSGMADSDQVLLETFGFAYSETKTRAVAVFLRYLSDLSPEHQQIWKAHLLNGRYRLHPYYYKSHIIGDWYDGTTVFEAFLEELHQINEMSALIGKPSFFNKTFRNERPKHFSFLLRPTLREYNDFVHLLDRMLSDNINAKFFKQENLTFSVERPGTILMLETWIAAKMRLPDPSPKDEMLSTFRDIRAQRQRPAHAIQDDEFDEKYFHQQRELIQRAYVAVRTLRLLFANHPRLRGYRVPDWLQTGEILVE